MNAANPYRGSGSSGILHSSSSKPNASIEVRGPSEDSPPKRTSPGGESASREEPEKLCQVLRVHIASKRGNDTKCGRQSQTIGASCHSSICLDHLLDPTDVAGDVGVDAWR